MSGPPREWRCDRCGSRMDERNCKVTCPNCGSRFDCSDLTVNPDPLPKVEEKKQDSLTEGPAFASRKTPAIRR